MNDDTLSVSATGIIPEGPDGPEGMSHVYLIPVNDAARKRDTRASNSRLLTIQHPPQTEHRLHM